MIHLQIRSLITIASVLLLGGCQPTVPVSSVTVRGQVMAAGETLTEGLITFVPIGLTRGAKISTSIENGMYALGTDAGLSVGDYRVEIFGLPPGVKAMAEGQPVVHTQNVYREISERYNANSELVATLGEGDNEKNFQVDY